MRRPSNRAVPSNLDTFCPLESNQMNGETLAEKLNAHIAAMAPEENTPIKQEEIDENGEKSPLDGMFENINDPNFLMKLLVEGQGIMPTGQACPFCYRLILSQEEFNLHVSMCRPADTKDSPDVSVRSRESIINSVLESPSLIRDCVCPYCLLISSRRDNTRAHIRRSHPDQTVRSFVVNVDATVAEVKEFNMSRKGNTIPGRNVCEMAKGLVRRARIRNNTSPNSNSSHPVSLNEEKLWPERRRSEENDANSNNSAETWNHRVEPEPVAAPQRPARQEENTASVNVYSGPPQQASQTMYGCVLCNGAFPNGMELHKHVVSIHRTFFRCNLCRAEFVQVEHLDVHIRFSH